MLLCEAFSSSGPGAARMVAAAVPEALLETLRSDVALAIWDRAPPPPCRRVRALLGAAPFRAAVEDDADACVAALARCLPSPLPAGIEADMRRLATTFAALVGSRRVRARLEGIADDACRRFHADAVGSRLLCTYAGAGTEWLPRVPGPDNRLPAAPPRLPTGAVAILKGSAHPDSPGGGLIHRSPPMGTRPRPRLLFCLDEPGRTFAP